MEEIKPPTFLNAATKKKYIQVAQMLMEDGNWKDGDDIALSALFANYQRWIQAERAIKKNKSLTFTTDSNYSQQIPEISIANNAMKSMLSFIKEFGLSPKERKKLKDTLMGDGSSGGDDELNNMIVK
ncbi:P27 family predicted phage terminase small subunit [Virgibacillus natechei]|uniref:P27 family predicted phage terminase small subunit n=1 Tax=Virgibacillus natechei TaxID=1216297 RepID=A0ABS4ICA1_9BACI|nr:phage terminase small subunit P27 family [Virgibacillus natechei]MBP1967986.1 P27 family predicted phage terminase small subunit [Virgibacillus natechei]UZD14728.1 phage terminase small subunit P27 family [Virgibacillus natechei]